MATPTLGEKIRDRREAKGFSLRELARRTDVSSSLVSAIETGVRYPSEPVLARLAGELGLSSAGLKRLDNRSSLAKLRQLMESDHTWGLAFKELAAAGRAGRVAPDDLRMWLEQGK